MIYGSVCSGIEAASVAWQPLGWRAAFFSETEKFPGAVLAHRFPDVPKLGDMTRFKEWPDAAIDVLVGGTPCQSFSVAGLRKGLADPRGNLMLTYLAIADRYRPKWIVWENVPGVRSSGDGRDFGAFLGALGELGYGWAYRSLDAQYAGLAQRRERVFVVGYLGDWRRAAEVLFERESLSRHTPACVAQRQKAAKRLARAAGGCRLWRQIAEAFGAGSKMGWCQETASALNAHFGDKMGLENQHALGDASLFVTHTLRADGFDASEDGTGRGTPLVVEQNNMASTPYLPSLRAHETPNYAIAFSSKDHGADAAEDIAPTLRAMGHDGSHANAGGQVAVAFQSSQSGVRLHDTHATLDANNGPRRHNGVVQNMAVRRLTPRECCRLMGFPDDWTQIPWRGKPAEQCPDGPRYKAIGNSMPVPVMRWIGERIETVDAIGLCEAAE